MVFFNNYVDQCNKKGVSPSAAAIEMGFNKSMITRWKTIERPRQATLQRMCAYFGCTVDDLLKDTKKSPSEDGDGDERIIQFLLSLPHERLRGILLALNAPSEVLAALDRIEPKE